MDKVVLEKQIIIKTQNGKSAPGKALIQTWTKPERTKRALKWLGAFWALALISVFLPLAHFVLVPFFLLTGPLVGAYLYRQESLLLGGEGTCPQCMQTLPLARGPDRWPSDDMCSLCQTNVILDDPTKAIS